MSEHPERAQLEALEAKLAAKREVEAKPHMEEHYSQAQNGWRMVTELVAGLLIGACLGFGLDLLLGTQPFMMIVFVLLGFVAGVKTMLATARDMQVAHKDQGSDRA